MSADASGNVIRILCVDDHPVVREGIAQIVNLYSDMKVVASAGTGEEGVSMFSEHRPDVVLMDLELPSMDGLDAIRAIRQVDAGARIVVLSVHQGEEDVWRSLAVGASAYLLKDTLSEDLVRTIRSVHAGERVGSGEVASRRTGGVKYPALTRREIDVLALIAEGMRNRDIAATLGIGDETVHSHLKNIFEKLGVDDRTAAVTTAIRRGVLHIKS